MQLTDEHIDYIAKDLNYRGIVHDGLEQELVDHICSAVEEKMARPGVRFIDAYHEVLRQFGHTAGLRKTQQQTLLSENSKPKVMIRNYFIIALRNLRKHSFYTSINVAGLSVGISICLIILLFVVHELRYDRHHEHADRIYRVHSDIFFGGSHFDMIYAPAPMAATLVNDYPEVEAAVHFRERGSYLVKRDAENIKETRVIWAGKDFFKVFTVPVVAGNAQGALDEPNTIVISQRIAEKFFRGENPVGQTLTLDNKIVAKVTAVYEDMPSASHFHFDIIISMEGLNEAKNPNFLSNNFQTYVLLREGADPQHLESKFPELIAKHITPQVKQIFGEDFTLEKFEASGNHIRYSLQPLTDIHLKSDLMGEFEPNFDITYLYLFTAIAAFILAIACINFMNLSTARSANRAKEVGVRKVMGSYRSHLVRQFLLESVLLSLVSFIFAVALAYLLLPVFNNLAGRSLAIPFGDPLFYVIMVAAALVVGVMAGIYPSFFLSAFKPVQVLKGNVSLGMKSGFIRSSLVVFQFMISIFLVIGTMVVFQQLDYIQNKKLGFNKDQVVTVDDAYALGSNIQAYKNEVMKSSLMEHATVTGYLPVDGGWRNDNPWWAQGKPAVQENMVSTQNWAVDHDYLKTMGMTLKSGRDFSRDFASDSNAVILNETAAQMFDFGKGPLGEKVVSALGSDESGLDRLWTLEVIGVVENFHFESLKEEVGPVMIHLAPRNEGSISFRFQSSDTKEVVELLEKTWKQMAPGQPFTYNFLDESFGRMYAAEMRLGKIFGIFSSVAIVIACLGLFALTAFTAEQRTKEIGIRKVLGASVTSIVLLLSKEFGKLVLIAFVLATPMAWWAVNKWLEDYEYKVEVGWGIYLLAGVVSFLIAWVTMSYQSFKAAASNPVSSLRSE
jgi:putative ABC transport system permease protein